MPKMNAAIPAASPATNGQRKLRRRPSSDVLRQASNGPTPVSKSKNRAIGTFTLLKNGGPTLILLPVNHSEKTGKRVPNKTAKQAASRIKLLKRKLDSRETSESSWLSLRR